jgi:ribosomal protein S12
VPVVQPPGDAAHRYVAEVEQVTSNDVSLICDNCGHAVDQHDRVALRYCAASNGHDQRGCICPGQITTTAEAAADAADAADAETAAQAQA